jgi:hypothetical protein
MIAKKLTRSKNLTLLGHMIVPSDLRGFKLTADDTLNFWDRVPSASGSPGYWKEIKTQNTKA